MAFRLPALEHQTAADGRSGMGAVWQRPAVKRLFGAEGDLASGAGRMEQTPIHG